jgi:hypothetical protein
MTIKEEIKNLALYRLFNFIKDSEKDLLFYLSKLTKLLFSTEFDFNAFIYYSNALFNKLLLKYKNKFISIKIHSLRELVLYIKYIGNPYYFMGLVYENLLSYARRKIHSNHNTVKNNFNI